jgi:hypothetical protein
MTSRCVLSIPVSPTTIAAILEHVGRFYTLPSVDREPVRRNLKWWVLPPLK